MQVWVYPNPSTNPSNVSVEQSSDVHRLATADLRYPNRRLCEEEKRKGNDEEMSSRPRAHDAESALLNEACMHARTHAPCASTNRPQTQRKHRMKKKV